MEHATHDQTARVLDALGQVTGHMPKRNGAGWKALCPAHDDDNPSLAVSEGDKAVVLTCHAGCDFGAIVEALNLQKSDMFWDAPRRQDSPRRKPDAPRRQVAPHRPAGNGLGKIEATYPYHDADGNLVFEVVRFDPKGFRQRRPDPNARDGWAWNLQGIERVLYRLPEVLEQAAMGRWVFVTEGEKDADRLASLGLTSTTCAEGAGKWRAEYSESLRGAQVVILPDNDGPGRKHAQQVAQSLHAAGVESKIIDLPDLPPKGDISDWLDAGGTDARLWQLVEAARPWEPDTVTESASRAAPADVAGEDDPLTELATARRLKEHHGQDLRHATGLGWLHWDGRRWQMSQKAAERCAHDMGRVIRAELADLGTDDPDTAKLYFRHAKAVEKASGVRATLDLGKALDGIDGDHVEWDAHPWLLNLPNGTLDLRTGQLLPHSRDHFLTKLCPTEYHPEATAPRWARFLDEIFGGDAELVEYIRWACGYALSGRTDHDVFFVLHGGGANGKTTFVNAVMGALGPDYAQQINPEELMQQRHARHTTELAQLRGARLVCACETTQGRRLNEALIKSLTGGDRIRARLMRENSFEFTPELKLLLSTNHKPTIRDDSGGLWRRIRLIPFEATFKENQADPHLADTLRAEAPGILTWAVEGARQVAAGEPKLPAAVRAATDGYRQESDTLTQFLDEMCETWENATVGKRELYEAYRAWAGGRCESKTAFRERVLAHGFEEDRHGHKRARVWRGIALARNEQQNFERAVGYENGQ
jgi:putative DNA primase/helicase